MMYTAVITGITAELYSAMAGLEALLDTQQAIINTLEIYIQESKKKVQELTKYVNS